MNLRLMCASLFLLFCSPALFPAEGGFLFFNDFRSENLIPRGDDSLDEKNKILDSGKLSAWLSFRLGGNAALYVKGSLDFTNESLTGGKAAKANGELDVFRISLLPAPFFFAELGRVHYQDILNLAAGGSFDGGLLRFTWGNHAVSAGGFYTGLLYKESAQIFMTAEDKNDYFDNDYFAPPHLLLALSYDFFPLRFPKALFQLNFLAQADLRKNPNARSAYALGKTSLALTEYIRFNAGALFSWSEYAGKTEYGMTSLLDLFINLNRIYADRLGFELKLFYGNFNNKSPIPVLNKKKLSFVYDPELIRLFTAKVEYLVRINRLLSFEAALTLFARVSADIIPNYPAYAPFENTESTGFLLGEEIMLNIVWAPASDFSLNLGTALFFPDSGPNSVYVSTAPVKWDIRIGVLISF